jgi:hypothetical protein
MRRLSWETRLAIVLVSISVLVYGFKYLVLGQIEGTYVYLLHALGFLPINVLLVTLVLNKLMNVRAKRDRLEKINMVIGTFFSEVGLELLKRMASRDEEIQRIRESLVVTANWQDADFAAVHNLLREHPWRISVTHLDMGELRRFLYEKRDFMMRLLENPILLEHETFTDMLRAIFHLAEEMVTRPGLVDLPASDHRHLDGDLNRALSLLVHQWVDYMNYLRRNYPYLFSLAMRLNPFDSKSSIVIQD